MAEEKDKTVEETDETAEETDETAEETDETAEKTDETVEETDGTTEETGEAAEKTDKIPEKPLDKMTAVELREVAKEIPEITGASGMKKADLLSAIKEARGITDEPIEKDKTAEQVGATVRNIKNEIRALKTKREAAIQEKNSKMATIYKRRISRLKKKTRDKAKLAAIA